MFFLSKKSFNAAVEREVNKRMAQSAELGRVNPQKDSTSWHIVHFLSDGKKHKTKEITQFIMAKTKCTNQTAYTSLNRLCSAGNIKRIKHGVYQIAE